MEEIIYATWGFVQFIAIVLTVVTGVIALALLALTILTQTVDGRYVNGGVGLRFISVSMLSLLIAGVVSDPKVVSLLLFAALLASRISVKLVFGRWMAVDYSEG